MARLFGIEINDNKKVVYSLIGIYGIGIKRAKKIVKDLNIDESKKLKELDNNLIDSIRLYIEKNYKVEGELRTEVGGNIRRMKDLRVYRGIRHKLGLPSRGQRTRRNAHTKKGKSMPVGGLKRVLAKK